MSLGQYGQSRFRTLAMACLVGLAVTNVVHAEEERAASTDSRFDCARLEEWNNPASAQRWLERSLWASQCYIFQARAVTVGDGGARTLALSHRVNDGVQQQVVQFLDGPPVSFERQARVGRVRWAQGLDDDVAASPGAIAEHLANYYEFRLGEEERVAGRPALRLEILPRDDQRYQHHWWLDRASGLVLKQVVLDAGKGILETFLLTQLQAPERYSGYVEFDQTRMAPKRDWEAAWLPPGFIAQPVLTHSSRGTARRHQVFSDGLASVSIFVEPDTGVESRLPSGVHRLGVTSATILSFRHQQRDWQVVVLGEVPPSVLERIAHSVEFTSDPTFDDGSQDG
ncbi:MucB/RseB C-terminal domain-containing protein [Halomonas sp. Bachu 37]|uniref:MucB/RseB C-terminal domain-containing protein n=1 Tax=Halomonas kashgarensis TaxID=3084920 RepID=UPI003216A957